MHRWYLRGDPFQSEFERLRKEMDNLSSLVTGPGRTASPFWRETKIFPLLNVIDGEDAYLVSAEIPGVDPSNLDIKIEGDTLTVRGERKSETVGTGASYHRRERAAGTFQRSLTLPSKVDANDVKADYVDGVLTITLAKGKEAVPRQIAIDQP